MRTKLGVLFFSFFFLCEVLAQGPVPKLSVVTDYGKCTYGLKDKSGKQIWKTEFTTLGHAEAKMNEKVTHHFWIAEKKGLFGVLNDSGGILIPFQFDKVVLFRSNCFIAYKKDAVELYSLSGEKKYSGADLETIYPLKHGYLISRNGQTGFLDDQFKERIPLSFTNISPAALYQHMDSNWPEPSSRILEVNQDRKYGIYDLGRGLVVPCKYEHIEMHWADNQCDESQAVYVAFRDNTRYILNSEGVLIDSLHMKEWPEFYQVPLDSCASKALAFCFVRVNVNYESGSSRIRVINLQTNERSKIFDEAYGNGNRILCREGKTWSVLDEHLQELTHWNKWNSSWQLVYKQVDEPFHQYHIQKWLEGSSVNLKNNQRVVIYSKPSKDQVYLNAGIYDYVLNKVMEPKYFQIRELEFEGKCIYWAFKMSKEDQKYAFSELGSVYSQMDIYDDQLNLLKSFRGDEIPQVGNRREHTTSSSLFFQKAGDKYGAVNGRGEQVIPARYKEYGQLVLQEYSNSRISETYYLLGNDYFGLFNQQGKQIIAEKHLQYQSMETILLASNADRTYTVYTKSGKMLLDNVSSYIRIRGRGRSSDNGCSYLKNDKYPTENLIFFVKGEQLFYVQGEQLSVADSETFELTSTYLQLAARTIIDQNGKLVDLTGLQLKTWYSKCPVQHQSLPIQSKSPPVKKNQTIARALNYQWERGFDPKSKSETWILKDPSGRRLSPRVFDYPFNPENRSGKVFRISMKYGLMSEVFKEALPPEYDYMFPVNNGYVLYKDSLWTYYNWKNHLFSPDSYDVISTYDWGGKRLVFKNSKVGILIDSSLTYLVPLTDSVEFLKKVNLIQLLELDKRDPFDLRTNYHLAPDAKPAQVYRQINNGQLIWYAYQRSTANNLLEIHPVDRNFLDNSPRISFRYKETIAMKKPVIKTPFYYTEEMESHDRTMNNDYETPSYNARTFQFFNYKIADGRLIPIQLQDIITNGLAMKKLDDLLTQKLNENQYFGQDCTDIAAKIERLKANFLITGYSIRFHWPEYPKFEFEIYFNQLNGILPKAFQKQVSEF